MDRRHYPERPLLGVGAILFDPPAEQVLLVQRGRAPAAGQWTFPGGLVEAGEGLRAACAREVREETGLTPRLSDLATVVERVILAGERPEYHYVILDFWGRAEGEPRAGSDVADARWVRLDEVSALSLTRGVETALCRALALFRGEPAPSPLLELD